MEQFRVHRAAQQARIGNTHGVQLLRERAGGDECGHGAPMKAAEVRAHQRREQAHAVMAGVVIEARVEAAAERNAQLPGGTHGRPAQRTFGGDVDGIGPLLQPALLQPAASRQTQAQAGVSRQADAGHFDRVDTAFIGMRFGLARTNQVDAVAACSQAGGKVVHGQRHAVDFRGVGFSDDADAHDDIRAGWAQLRRVALRGRGGRMTRR